VIRERRAREIKPTRKQKAVRQTKTVVVTIRLPTVIVEAIDELVEIGPYPNRTSAIRSILTQEVPRYLTKYQVAEDSENPAPAHEDGNNRRKNVSLFLPKQTFMRIEKMAKELGLNKSEFLRLLIDNGYRQFAEYLEVIRR
jgi:Arc/MetJ-type ribon-helix-helix transcriptional regulator